MKMAARIEAMGGAPHYAGTTKKVNGNAIWTGKLALAPERILLEPLTWRRPRRIFVNSMGDLFHEDVPDEWIDRAFAVMALAPQHTFQVLTKRAKRMRHYLADPRGPRRIYELVCDMVTVDAVPAVLLALGVDDPGLMPQWPRVHLDQWPLPNVWLGVSAERQQEADERIPKLLATPAAIRFVSAEPLLGPLALDAYLEAMRWGIDWSAEAGGGSSSGLGPRLDWIIVGGESGPGDRPMHPAWPRAIRDQCAAAGVPFFFKQWGAWADSTDADDLVEGNADRILAPDGSVLGIGVRTRGTMTGSVDPDWRAKGGAWMTRSNKQATGRLLDGIEHNGMPEAREVPAL
jgi:protein gp37